MTFSRSSSASYELCKTRRGLMEVGCVAHVLAYPTFKF
jgi:hypothetical protein